MNPWLSHSQITITTYKSIQIQLSWSSLTRLDGFCLISRITISNNYLYYYFRYSGVSAVSFILCMCACVCTCVCACVCEKEIVLYCIVFTCILLFLLSCIKERRCRSHISRFCILMLALTLYGVQFLDLRNLIFSSLKSVQCYLHLSIVVKIKKGTITRPHPILSVYEKDGSFSQ